MDSSIRHPISQLFSLNPVVGRYHYRIYGRHVWLFQCSCTIVWNLECHYMYQGLFPVRAQWYPLLMKESKNCMVMKKLFGWLLRVKISIIVLYLKAILCVFDSTNNPHYKIWVPKPLFMQESTVFTHDEAKYTTSL